MYRQDRENEKRNRNEIFNSEIEFIRKNSETQQVLLINYVKFAGFYLEMQMKH